MKFLIAGCGSIGKRHIRNLINIGYKDIIAYDTDEKTLQSVKEELNVEISNDFNTALMKVDAVFICTPNHLHTLFALKTVEAGKHVFIEKPLANKLEGLTRIKEISDKNDLIVQVGYNLQFHPIIKEVKKLIGEGGIGKILFVRIEYGSYLPNWRKTDYRENYAAKKSTGGGIIFDDIHEINYALSLFGDVKRVFCSANKVSNLEIETEDNAEITLEMERGFAVNIHMDYLQKKPVREFKIIGEKKSLFGDLNAHTLIIENGEERKLNFTPDYNLWYIEEVKHFIDCVKRNKKPINTFEDAVYDLKVVLAIKKSVELKKVIEMENFG